MSDITLSLDQNAEGPRDGTRPQPVLILALECIRPYALSARYSLEGVVRVRLGRGGERDAERRADGTGTTLTVAVPDQWMSSRHATIEYSYGRWVLCDDGSKNGTVVNGATTERHILRDGDVIELGRTLFLFRDAMPLGPAEPFIIDLDPGATPSQPRAVEPGLTTLMAPFARDLQKLTRIAATDISVMIQGESGTGKEVLARALHRRSRRPGRFAAVNCGAIPAHLVESELFGHRRGAFSGAVEHREGLIRSADRGTLFLDEIGDLPAPSQAALLRALQEREVVPVGASEPIAVDLRVVAATHRDLDRMVAHGSFRHDLYARLTGYRIAVPAVRARREDLGLLIGVLFAKLCERRRAERAAVAPGIDIAAARALFAYPWPLNVRELEQALRTALVLAGESALALDHLPQALRRANAATADVPPAEDAAAPTPTPTPTPTPPTFRDRDDESRCQALRDALRAHRGNISAVARHLGKDRKQIQRWIKRFHIDTDSFRS